MLRLALNERYISGGRKLIRHTCGATAGQLLAFLSMRWIATAEDLSSHVEEETSDLLRLHHGLYGHDRKCAERTGRKLSLINMRTS